MADVTVKICDRCGKEIGDRWSTSIFTPVLARSELAVRLFKKDRYWNSPIDKNEYDLCEDCTKKLAEFLENREGDEGVTE